MTRPRPQEAQIIVDLRHRADGGAGIAAGGLLVDGDGGGQAVNRVHIRLFHLAQELPRVAGQALHIATLTLGINGVEGQGGLARAGQTGHHDQLVSRNGDVHVAQVVLPRALDDDVFIHAANLTGVFLPLKEGRKYAIIIP